MPDENQVRLRNKIIAYVVAWLLALFATNPNGGLWSLAWMFPLGLLAFFHAPAGQGGWGTLLGATAVYLVHAFFYFRSRTRRTTWILLGILALVLICNVSGCRQMLNGH